jgi:hypothetical protein
VIPIPYLAEAEKELDIVSKALGYYIGARCNKDMYSYMNAIPDILPEQGDLEDIYCKREYDEDGDVINEEIVNEDIFHDKMSTALTHIDDYIPFHIFESINGFTVIDSDRFDDESIIVTVIADE